MRHAAKYPPEKENQICYDLEAVLPITIHQESTKQDDHLMRTYLANIEMTFNGVFEAQNNIFAA